jgi:hypothetical protein
MIVFSVITAVISMFFPKVGMAITLLGMLPLFVGMAAVALNPTDPQVVNSVTATAANQIAQAVVDGSIQVMVGAVVGSFLSIFVHRG